MSERSQPNPRSHGEHCGRRGLAITGGVAAAALALAACSSSTSPNSANASPSAAYGTSAPGNQAGNINGVNPSVSVRNYCDDSAGNRAQPIAVKNNRLVVAIHGECTGDPTAPVGLYIQPTQEAGHAVVALPNGAQFDASCIAKGEYVRTDEASSGTPPGHTGSSDWLEGTDPARPEAGDLYVPWSNTGFVVTSLGSFSLSSC